MRPGVHSNLEVEMTPQGNGESNSQKRKKQPKPQVDYSGTVIDPITTVERLNTDGRLPNFTFVEEKPVKQQKPKNLSRKIRPAGSKRKPRPIN